MSHCSCQRNPVVAALRNPALVAMRNPVAWEPAWDFTHHHPVDKKLVRIHYPYEGLEAQEFKTSLIYLYSDALMLNPEWRGFVAHVCKDARGSNPVQLAQHMSQWLEDHINYLPEPGELIQDPRNTIRYAVGDCDDYSAALVAMLEAAGFETRLLWMQHIQGWHVFVEAKYGIGGNNQTWFALDPSMPEGRKGYQIPQDKIKLIHPVDRTLAAKYAWPDHLAIALTADEGDIFEIQGGMLGAAGVRYISRSTLLRFPEDAEGKLFDKIKKASPKIAAAVKKAGAVFEKIEAAAKKVVNSPVFKGIAKVAAGAIGGPAAVAAVQKGIDAANKVFQKIDDVKARAAKVKEMVTGLRGNGTAIGAVAAKAIEAAAQHFEGVEGAAIAEGAKSLKERMMEAGAKSTAVQTLGELAEKAPAIAEKVAEVAKEVGESAKEAAPKLLEAIKSSTSDVMKEALAKTLGPIVKHISSSLPKISTTQIADLISNPKTAKSLINLPGAVRSLLPSNLQTAIDTTQSQQADKTHGIVATLLGKAADVLIRGKDAVPFNLQADADLALDVDKRLSLDVDMMKELHSMLEAQKSAPNYQDSLATFTILDSNLKEALGDKEDLMMLVADKLKPFLGDVDIHKMNIQDLADVVHSNQLSGGAMMMLAASPIRADIEKFSQKLHVLDAKVTKLTNDLLKLKGSFPMNMGLSNNQPSSSPGTIGSRFIAPPHPMGVSAPGVPA